MAKKIIIAGGGTGGHIFPAIAIAHALLRQDRSVELLFVGARGKMEMEKVPQAGFRIEGLDIAGLNRSSLIKNIGLPLKLIRSFLQVRRIVRDFMPDAAIGVGGYSSFPVLRYAQSRGIPTFIHESNSFAGKANIWLGKKARRIYVAATGMDKFFPTDRILITGNPVRKNIVSSRLTRDEGISFFGLDPARKTILATGGSLGAKGINEAIATQVDQFDKNDVQLVWQTGKPFAAQAKALVAGKKNIWTSDFINSMEHAYAAADIVISRSGAMAMAELCVVKKPVIFVPFPFAAEDHQTANAISMVHQHAALMVKDAEAKNMLVSMALTLAKNDEEQRSLRENIGRLAITDADDRIATDILKELKG